jgi:hypothetical protein
LYLQFINETILDSRHAEKSLVHPIPKAYPPKTIEEDIRPISLTCQIAKVLEGLTCKRLLSQLSGKIDEKQYAQKGRSTTDALIHLLHLVYETLDKGHSAIRRVSI